MHVKIYIVNNQSDLLTSINLDDLVSSFGWQDYPFPARLLQKLFLKPCLLYTSDAADERSSVDLGGRRIIKKKMKVHLECSVSMW